MPRKTILAAAALAVIAGVAHSQQAPAKPASPADAHRQLINTYCIGCHSARLKTGNLVLEGLSLDKVAENAVIWEKVIRKLNGGQMPPQGMPRPNAGSSQALAQYLATSLDRTLATNADPGRAPIHRMNRTPLKSTPRNTCRRTMKATGSTTLRMRCAFRRRCSTSIWLHRASSARWP
jgi:mono/diheme cytochrome c family protein